MPGAFTVNHVPKNAVFQKKLRDTTVRATQMPSTTHLSSG